MEDKLHELDKQVATMDTRLTAVEKTTAQNSKVMWTAMAAAASLLLKVIADKVI